MATRLVDQTGRAVMSEASRLVNEGKAEAARLVDEAASGDLAQGGFTNWRRRLQVVIAIAMLVSVGVLKTQLTAFLFHVGHQPPTAYSLYSCAVTCAMLAPVFIVRPQYWAVRRREMALNLSLIVVFTACDLGFTNIALSRLSTALQQCIASTNPFWTILIESVLHRKWQHVLIYCSVCGLVVGAVMASIGSVARLSIFGLCSAVVAVLCSSSKYVFCHKAFRDFKGELGALALLFWVDLLMIPVYILWTALNGSLFTFFSPQNLNALTIVPLTGTAALGGVRALTQYFVLLVVSATSMSTANIFTQILNIVLSIPLQGTPITPFLGTGIGLVCTFSVLYTFFKSSTTALPWIDERLPFLRRWHSPIS